MRLRLTTPPRASAEAGRAPKTDYVPTFIDDEGNRRAILTQLNRQERRHSFALGGDTLKTLTGSASSGRSRAPSTGAAGLRRDSGCYARANLRARPTASAIPFAAARALTCFFWEALRPRM